MFAKLVVIEGQDKAGKSTQAPLLAHALRRYGDHVAHVRVPFNDGCTHRLIYRMLHDGSARAHPNLFQIVQFVNKMVFQWTKLLWLWLTCDWIVLDRWRLSTVVYGDATGANMLLTRVMYHMLVTPRLTIVLHGPTLSRDGDDDYERDGTLQNYVRAGYFNWVVEHPIGHELVGNNGSIDDVHEQVMLVTGVTP